MTLSVFWPDFRRLVALASLLFFLPVVSGCAEGTVEPDLPATPSSQTTPDKEEPTSVVPDQLPEFVTAKGVVLATVIIATGNVGSAVEQGLVSPQEVDLARKAIAEGHVQDWVDAAEVERRVN